MGVLLSGWIRGRYLVATRTVEIHSGSVEIHSGVELHKQAYSVYKTWTQLIGLKGETNVELP